MLLGAAGEGGRGGIDAVLPSSAELFFSVLMFIIVVAVIVTITVALVKRFSSTRNDELEHWRERALRAEAESDLLKEQGVTTRPRLFDGAVGTSPVSGTGPSGFPSDGGVLAL